MKKLMTLLTLVIASVHCAVLSEAKVNTRRSYGKDPNTVYTKSGPILGSSELESRLGKKIYSFLGIRYAKAPTGDRRFKAPEPIDPWNESILNATVDGPICPQPVLLNATDDVTASEDCLRLNVYTTKIPSKNDHPSKPVMIFFHAGGFYSSGAVLGYFGPQYLLDMDIVLVTVNYRLGSLGFISTGDEQAPGNFGLKDQVIAMRWVRDHIEAFGGNANKVTIFGYSAGSISVALHMVSPMSKGLFHRAIAMSAAPTGPIPTPPHQFHLAQKQARILDCPDNNSTEIIQCLKTKSPFDISTSFFSFQEIGIDPILIWQPVVEPDHNGERFLTEDPVRMFAEGRFAKVPFMTGVTEFEFANLAYGVVANESLRKEWNDNFFKVAPIAFTYERDTPRSRYISEKLRNFYFDNRRIDERQVENLGKAYADSLIGFPVNRLALLVANKNTKPVYYYKFAYKGIYSHFYLPDSNKPIGPVHHDDLMYLFHIPKLFPLIGPNDPALRTVERVTKLWTNFAKFGNPTPEKDPITDREIWEALTPHNNKYMQIKCHLKMKHGMFSDRYALWDSLFPLD